MHPRVRIGPGLMACAFLLSPLLAADDAPTKIADLPVNQWGKLPTEMDQGYSYSQPIYVPSRKQVLWWGAIQPIYNTVAVHRNDVLAFDASAGRWVPDYASAEGRVLAKARQQRLGVWTTGTGAMLDAGTPAPSAIVNAVCYDSKRNQVVYAMQGLMAAYDPTTKQWRDLKAETELYDRRLPGAPPVRGAGMCYDPVNDEIVLFPHWGGMNTDLRDVTGELSANYGTFVYRFTDNVWRRVGETFGPPDVRAARKSVLDVMGALSRALDEAWVMRRRPDVERATKVGKDLAALCATGGLPASVLSGATHERASRPWHTALKTAAARATAGDMAGTLKAGSEALRQLHDVLDQPLRVEPPARAATPMVYDPKQKVIVMFGGHTGLVRTDLGNKGRSPTPPGLNDTWLYDCTTKQWRELKADRRPSVTRLPNLVYDPASGLVLLVTRSGRYDRNKTVAVWSLDVAKGEWQKRAEQPWTWPLPNEWMNIALDESDHLLLLAQQEREGKQVRQVTYALRLDVEKMPAEEAPEWKEPPPITPINTPPADAEVKAKLQALPTNTWTHMRPPRDADTRDWGNAAADSVRGWLVYYGGGHSTYQVNNPDIYVVDANRWVTTAGDHNDWIPPTGWGGVAMGMRGGPHAHHMRNSYVAVDGRMYKSVGVDSRRWGAESAKRKGDRYAWFFDVDRGGVWRQQKVTEQVWGEGVSGLYGQPHLADPAGRIVGFGGALEPYDGRFFAGEVYFNEYDIYTGRLRVVKVPKPLPDWVGEYRPFCFRTGENQVFFYEYRASKDKVLNQRTWIYDITANKFTNVEPKRQPTGQPTTVVYLADQDAVLGTFRGNTQWVYSFKRNTWAPLPLKSDGTIAFATPYAQMVYVERFGLCVNTGHASRGVAVMRPDLSAVNWNE